MNLTSALELSDNLVKQPDCQCCAYSASECCCDTTWPEQFTDIASETIKELVNQIHDKNGKLTDLQLKYEDTLRASKEGWRYSDELERDRKKLSIPINDCDLHKIVNIHFTDAWLIEKCKQIVREAEESKGIK